MKNLLKCVSGSLVVLLFALLAACSDDDAKGSATLEVHLTDAPAEYEQVNIDVVDVQVNAGTSEQGWTSLNVNKGIYNLLDLTNGLDTLLGSATIPAGTISQVRLVLGDRNTIKLNGSSSTLTTPSAQQSGLKVQINTELKEGITYKIVLDFDAARSIVPTGSGKFNLKPVIRAITTAQDGAIKGTVSPADALPVVYAIHEADTVSTYANEMGNFMVTGLAPQSYKIVIIAKSGAKVEKEEVSVTAGNVTDVGQITF